ncbi:MAG TPA: porin [Opitutaceae bacterium]|nr:porin [Opitutaceae bacterium]
MISDTIRLRLIATLASLAVPPSLGLAQDARDDELRLLREQIRQLDQKLRVLERKQELKDETAEEAAKTTPVVAAGASGFSLTSPDKKFQLRIRANLQADARFFVGDNVAGNDTFLIRRLRPSFEGTLGEKFGFRVMPDFAPATFNLLDAYVTYQHSPSFNVLVGKTKAPFDLERLVSQTDLLFLERSYPTSLAANRDLGVQIYGDVFGGTLSYQIGWLNGARDNDSSVTDTDDAKEVATRLFAHPFKNDIDSPFQGLGIGLAASYGEKTSGSPNSYRTHSQQTFFSWRSTVVNAGGHTRTEPQAYFYQGSLGLIGSWISSKQGLSNGAGTAVRDVTSTGWFVAAHYVLTGEDATYRGVTPKTGFSWKDGTWGAWEVAARYGVLDVGDEAFPLFANLATSASTAKGSTLGVNWYLNRNVKASFNFEHTAFSGGASGTVTREDENAILTRVQLRY